MALFDFFKKKKDVPLKPEDMSAEESYQKGMEIKEYLTAEHYFPYIEAAAKKGHPDANAELSRFYLVSRGKEPRNYDLALSLALKSAELGSMKGNNLCGSYYWFGDVTQRDRLKAVKYYTVAAEMGDMEAMVMLGDGYNFDNGITKDYDKALYWYEKAANKGDAYSREMCAEIFDFGKGRARDGQQAAKWYKIAAEKGNAYAQFNLGNLYRKGVDVEENQEKAFYWYSKAAEQNHNPAQNNLGYMYRHGIYVNQDYEKALEFYEKAARQGNKYAWNNIGVMYEEGFGVHKQLLYAMYCYRKAAKLGNEKAAEGAKKLIPDIRRMRRLEHEGGISYFKALSMSPATTDEDIAKCINPLTQAADLGDRLRRITLQLLYRYSKLVPVDIEKADYYLALSKTLKKNDLKILNDKSVNITDALIGGDEYFDDLMAQ